jgi:hypothetical protein
MLGGGGRAGRVWHVSEREQTLPFPCDSHLTEPDDVCFRGSGEPLKTAELQ